MLLENKRRIIQQCQVLLEDRFPENRVEFCSVRAGVSDSAPQPRSRYLGHLFHNGRHSAICHKSRLTSKQDFTRQVSDVSR